jgi:RNA polymerase sigma-70 factor (ECF subfamily)
MTMEYPMAATLETKLLEHRDELLGFLLALTRNPERAEEVFQEVALAILEEARKGTVVEKFLPWAHEIARRRVQEHYRKQTRWTPIPESMTEIVVKAFEENPIEAETARARQEALLSCLEKLARRARELISIRYVEGKTPTDIAARLGLEVASVNVTLSRSRRALEECVARRLRAGKG